MQLALFNGSPREIHSNTKILLEQFLKGYKRYHNNYKIHYLAEENLSDCRKSFISAENVILGFPFRSCAMPSLVKEFIEKLPKINTNKRIGFLVQSGHAESYHICDFEPYLVRLSQRLNCDYIGTIIKGGGESVRLKPYLANKTLFKKFQKLGEHFAQTSELEPQLLQKIKSDVRFSPFKLFMIKILIKIGIRHLPFDQQLKMNDVYDKKDAQPYLK